MWWLQKQCSITRNHSISKVQCKPQKASVLLQLATSATVGLGNTAKDSIHTICQRMLGTGKAICACVRRQLNTL